MGKKTWREEDVGSRKSEEAPESTRLNPRHTPLWFGFSLIFATSDISPYFHTYASRTFTLRTSSYLSGHSFSGFFFGPFSFLLSLLNQVLSSHLIISPLTLPFPRKCIQCHRFNLYIFFDEAHFSFLFFFNLTKALVFVFFLLNLVSY